MTCPHCRKSVGLPHPATTWLETYKPDGSCLTVMDCCGKGVVLSATIRYSAERYLGDETVDDWGRQIKKAKEAA